MPAKRSAAKAAPASEQLGDHLHRTVCQTLTSVRLLTSTLAVKHADRPALAADLRRLDELLVKANEELRTAVARLRQAEKSQDNRAAS